MSNDLNLKDGNKATQSDLINFLAIGVLDNNNEYFEAGFQKLTLKSQNEFFSLVANEGKLVEALNFVPKSTNEIAIKIGHAHPHTIDEAIKKLCEFKNLAKITFDLSQTTYYTQSVRDLVLKSVIILSEKAKGLIACPPLSLKDRDVTEFGPLAGDNDTERVVHVMQGIIDHLVNHPVLGTIDFKFIRPSGTYSRIAILNHYKMQKAPKVSSDPLNRIDYSGTTTFEDKWVTWPGM